MRCVGMDDVETRRNEAARARRLLVQLTDPLSRKLLSEYAAELEAQADGIEAEREDDRHGAILRSN